MASYLLVKIFVFLLCVVIKSAYGGDDGVSFNQNYHPLWGANHVTRLNDGKQVQLLLDQSSGSGFRSNLEYGSGIFRTRMKIPDKNTDGTIISFYLTSAADHDQNPGVHDELDFEFFGLGNGAVSTNVFASDAGGREQKFKLWFDPRKDFHTYSILWNPYHVVFFVDEVPVRVFKNNKAIGVNYPSKAMHTEASIWTADWAGKVDWTQSPFITTYEQFGIDGCAARSSGDQSCDSPGYYWNHNLTFNPAQQRAYDHVRKVYLVYDYCTDPLRSLNHPECKIPTN